MSEVDCSQRGCLTCLNLRRERGGAFCDQVAASTCVHFKLRDRDLTRALHWTVQGVDGKALLFGCGCTHYGKPLESKSTESNQDNFVRTSDEVNSKEGLNA